MTQPCGCCPQPSGFGGLCGCNNCFTVILVLFILLAIIGTILF